MTIRKGPRAISHTGCCCCRVDTGAAPPRSAGRSRPVRCSSSRRSAPGSTDRPRPVRGVRPRQPCEWPPGACRPATFRVRRRRLGCRRPAGAHDASVERLGGGKPPSRPPIPPPMGVVSGGGGGSTSSGQTRSCRMRPRRPSSLKWRITPALKSVTSAPSEEPGQLRLLEREARPDLELGTACLAQGVASVARVARKAVAASPGSLPAPAR